MGADDRRHHGLAIEGDPNRTFGQRNFALSSDSGDDAALDKQRSVFNGSGAVTRNYSRAFEQGGLSGSRPRH